MPTDGVYQIIAYGAQGGDGFNFFGTVGGLGAERGGDFTLTAGQTLDIAVGGGGGDYSGIGSGGGSFVTWSGSALVIAGGGGGNGGANGTNGDGSNGDGSNGGGAGGGFSGGGSFLSDLATNPIQVAGFQSGDGLVTIEDLPSQVP